MPITLGLGAHWALVRPGLLIAGISNDILTTALGHEAVCRLPPERSATGSAASNTARYLGSAVGLTIISLLIAGPDKDALFSGWQRAVVASVAVSFLGIFAMIAAARVAPRRAQGA